MVLTIKKENWTEEEWYDLCSICNPQNTLESIKALRKHDNKQIEKFVKKLDQWLQNNDEKGIEFIIKLRDEYKRKIKQWKRENY